MGKSKEQKGETRTRPFLSQIPRETVLAGEDARDEEQSQ